MGLEVSQNNRKTAAEYETVGLNAWHPETLKGQFTQMTKNVFSL